MDESHALPDTTRIHVPEDVQADIASHLPSSEKQRLISTSRAFFRSALEDRYRTCGTEDQAQKIRTAWHRWRGADPFLIIIPRLRRLRYADVPGLLLQHDAHTCSSDPCIAPLVREVVLVPSVTFFRSSPPRRYQWDDRDVAAGDEDSALRQIDTEFLDTLSGLENVTQLVLDLQMSSRRSALGRIIDASWPLLAPRLQSLVLKVPDSKYNDAVVLGPHAVNLRHLTIIATRYMPGAQACLARLALDLISSAQHSLTLLKIEIEVHGDSKALYEGLRRLFLPNLRHFGVVSPFCDGPAPSGEENLVPFIRNHTALQTLCVVPNSGTNGIRRVNPTLMPDGSYVRFLQLVADSMAWRTSPISSLALGMPPAQAASTDIISALGLLSASLEELWLGWYTCSKDNMIAVFRSIGRSLPHLKSLSLCVSVLTPLLLDVLAHSFAGLQTLSLHVSKLSWPCVRSSLICRRLCSRRQQKEGEVMPKENTITEAGATVPPPQTHRVNNERILAIEEYLRTSHTGLSRVSVRDSEYRFWKALEILPVYSSLR
jgi:hypothetical protein